MKKFAIVLLALALVLTLAACSNNPAITYASPRWKDEEHTFKILKAVDEDPSLVEGYEETLAKADEVVPTFVSGTYKMKIVVNNTQKTCTYTTEQTLYVAYPTELLEGYAIWDTPDEEGNTLSAMVASAEENPFSYSGNFTTLKSYTATSVTFQNEASQRPYSSTNEVDGFYIGKTAQTISKYKLETNYEWSAKNKVTITVNGEKQSTSGTYKEKFIDANQILLYTRSLEKSSTSFQDSPVVTVYMPKLDKVVTAAFSFAYKATTYISVDGEFVFVNLNAVGVVINNSVLLLQFNVPDSVNSDNKNLDSIPNAATGSTLNKYTTLRFRAGVYSYHLADYSSVENGNEILTAIKQTSST